MVELLARGGRDSLQARQRAAFLATEAIAITGVTRTPVVLDELGNSLTGAIPARDTRAQEIAARNAIDPEFCAEAAHYDAFHPAARLKWISQQNPKAIVHRGRGGRSEGLHRRAAHRAHRERSDREARLAAAASSLDGPSLLSRLDLPEDLVPDLLPPGSVIDRVRTSLPEPFNALAGRPVVMASHDTWSGVVGMGALVAGRAYNVSGTTETFGVMTPQAGRRRPA